MDPIENIEQVLKMVGRSIDDVSSCEEDLKRLDSDFTLRFPHYANTSVSNKEKEMLDDIKERLRMFRKRTYVKTVFSYIEGIVFSMKRILLEHSDSLSAEDIIKLQEYQLVGPSLNRLREEPVFIRFDENVKYTFKRYCELRTRNYEVTFNCAAWADFKECIKIRNRITHPKHSSELIITDNELTKVIQAYNWFFTTLVEIQNHEIY